jgi:RISC-loading complex subunit TARBP2
MAYLQGKTPISFLQELCTKRGITPQYDLIANEGAVHEPTFVFKVTSGEYVGTGKGPSKKKAKHNAAQSVLNQMLGVTNGQPQMVEDYTQLAQPTNDAMVGNPVGELQELTQKRLWPPPVYEFTSEQGPPHAREFVCTVKLMRLSEPGEGVQAKGVGKSKKLAKRNGAFAMLQTLKNLMGPGGDGEIPHEEFDDESIPLPGDSGKQAYTALKEGKRITTLTPQASQQITQFYNSLKNSAGKNLVSLQGKSLNAPSTNYCQMLQEIAEEQRFEVTYVDIQELSHSGQRQCLVQLSTMPVAVCHGMGPSADEAHAQAAHNALQYLKIMTKKA